MSRVHAQQSETRGFLPLGKEDIKQTNPNTRGVVRCGSCGTEHRFSSRGHITREGGNLVAKTTDLTCSSCGQGVIVEGIPINEMEERNGFIDWSENGGSNANPNANIETTPSGQACEDYNHESHTEGQGINIHSFFNI